MPPGVERQGPIDVPSVIFAFEAARSEGERWRAWVGEHHAIFGACRDALSCTRPGLNVGSAGKGAGGEAWARFSGRFLKRKFEAGNLEQAAACIRSLILAQDVSRREDGSADGKGPALAHLVGGPKSSFDPTELSSFWMWHRRAWWQE